MRQLDNIKIPNLNVHVARLFELKIMRYKSKIPILNKRGIQFFVLFANIMLHKNNKLPAQNILEFYVSKS